MVRDPKQHRRQPHPQIRDTRGQNDSAICLFHPVQQEHRFRRVAPILPFTRQSCFRAGLQPTLAGVLREKRLTSKGIPRIVPKNAHSGVTDEPSGRCQTLEWSVIRPQR